MGWVVILKVMKKIMLFIFCLSLNIGFSQKNKSKNLGKTIAIVGGIAHVGNGEIIENSVILIKNDKINLVANMATVRIDMRHMQVIDANEKHVYPGFIIPNCTIGSEEFNDVKLDDDELEIEPPTSNIISIENFDDNFEIFESMKSNGILIGQITKQWGGIIGISSIIQFDALNWQNALVKENDGIHIYWPDKFMRGRWWLGDSDNVKRNKRYNKQVDSLNQHIINGIDFIKNPKSSNLLHEVMNPLFDKSINLFFHVNDKKGIKDVIRFSNKHDLGSITIVGGAESHLVKEVLKKNNISVLLRIVHSLPVNEDYAIDLPFVIAKILDDAGILVGLETSGDMERMNSRNLPFYAGTVAAHGVEKENALSMITLNTAKILGIDKTYGSIEIGKQATLFISDGDALDMRTNKVSHAFIDGREISLETHQTQLWKKYSNKFKAEK